MKSKNEYLQMLSDQMTQWQAFIDSLPEAKRTAPDLPEGWSIKDVMAHLMAWQQVTNARLDAALSRREPTYPDWFSLEIEEAEGQPINDTNARVYSLYQHQPWPAVYRGWQSGFQRTLDSTSALPEPDLLTPGRYPWFGDYPLAAVLDGTYEHHAEHMEWLREGNE